MFTDVPAWAEGYVNLCSSLGIVAGVGDGKFDPNATVTTAQAVLMLCRALGYFQNAADFGDNWMLAATAKGTAAGPVRRPEADRQRGPDPRQRGRAGVQRPDQGRACPVQRAAGRVLQREPGHHLLPGASTTLQTLGYKNFDLVYTHRRPRPSTAVPPPPGAPAPTTCPPTPAPLRRISI